MKQSMTDAEYRLVPAINYSNLKHMRKSPLHYRHAVDSPPDPDLNQKLAMFRAVHTLVLEPFQFNNEYAVYEGRRDKRTKAYQQFLSENAGKSILSVAEHEKALAIAEAVSEHPWVIDLLAADGTSCEVAMVWDDETAGPCKGKADILHYSEEQGLIVADLKTYATTDNKQVGRDGVRNGWHIQFAHYLHGAAHHFGLDLSKVKYRAFSVIAEAEAPHDVCVCEWHEESLDFAMIEHRRLLDTVAQCEKDQRWPGRSPMQFIYIPDYLR